MPHSNHSNDGIRRVRALDDVAFGADLFALQAAVITAGAERTEPEFAQAVDEIRSLARQGAGVAHTSADGEPQEIF
jgi:hypothetical protein